MQSGIALVIRLCCKSARPSVAATIEGVEVAPVIYAYMFVTTDVYYHYLM